MQDKISPRQLTVLTVTALLAPGVDLLPRLAAGVSGGAGWLIPLVSLPALLLWTLLLTSLFKQEGSCLGKKLLQGFGPISGRGITLLYIIWGTLALSAQLGRSSMRLGVVYGPGAGGTLALLVLLLALWSVRKGMGTLCRSGELFWLAMGITVLAVAALSIPQMKWERLLPKWEEIINLPKGAALCLGALSPALFAAALTEKSTRTRGSRGKFLGWTAALCGLLTLLLGGMIGQLGGRLTAKLAHPFFIMVQGLSLQGAIARLEALALALWLMADYCCFGLLLAGVGKLAGKKRERRVPVEAALLALLIQKWTSLEELVELGGVLLGWVLPVLLWLRIQWMERRTSCGERG